MLTVMVVGVFVCTRINRGYADISYRGFRAMLKGKIKPLLAGDIEFALIGPEDAEISCVGGGSGG